MLLPTLLLIVAFVHASWTDAPMMASDAYAAAFLLCWLVWGMVDYHKRGLFK